MRILSRWTLLAGLLIAWDARVPAQTPPAAPPPWPPAWAVSSSPARIRVEPIYPGKPVAISHAELYLPDPQWAAAPIRIYDDSNKAFASEVIWSAPDEPATIVFDSSTNESHYWIYFNSNLPPLPLTDGKAGVWLETREGDGKSIDNLPDMLKAWNQSTKVLGRALVEGMDEGGNRFGPQTNLLMHMQGWFENAAPEHLQLATISWGASFVLVDGKEVVEWPGIHDIGQGLSGQHQGAIDLPAGVHQLDYYYSFVRLPGDTNPVMACLVAKGGPFSDWTLLLPERQFFRPIGNYGEQSYDLESTAPSAQAVGGSTPPLAINWSNQDQSTIYSDIPDIGLIALQLSVINTTHGPPPGTLKWTFDDGGTAQGQDVKHLFLRPGIRTVKVSEQDGDKTTASFTQKISVHADWPHAFKQPELHPEQEADALARDPTTLSASDLVSCLALFANFEKPDSILKLLPAIDAKMKDVSDGDLIYIKNAALLLARNDWAHYPEQEQLLRALIDRATAIAPPTPASASIISESKLALARLVLVTTDHNDEVRALIAAVTVSSLTGEEPRRLNLLQADLALATGDVAGARKLYEALTGQPSGPDVRSSIRHTARIGQARAFMDRKDFDAAEDALKEVAWQSPIDKLSPDWAITRLRLYQEENLPVAAYLWAKRLLPVVTESSRSELLFRLTELAFAQGDNDLAHKTLSELLQKHPYSEEAAQAKEKWPGQP